MTTTLPPTRLATQPAETTSAPSLTSLPGQQPAEGAVPERRRNTASLRDTDLLASVGAGLAAVALTALLFNRVAPLHGGLGFVIVAYLLFLGLYSLLVSFDEKGPIVRDRITSALVHSLAFLVVLALVFVIGFTLYRGREALVHSNFYTQTLKATGPLDPITSGGILHGIVGTLIMIGIALVIVVPLGLTCALFLAELPGPFARLVRTVTEAMTALPSIVAGLFIYAVLVIPIFGREKPLLGKGGAAAAIAISIEMLPIIIRTGDVVLRLVPGSLKEASLALGAGQWRTAWHVVLPTARSGLATAVILGTARGIGETAPVLLTAGFASATNVNPFKGPMVSLPLVAFDQVKSPNNVAIARGFGAAAALLVLVLLLFLLARVIGGRGPGDLTKRQQRARTRESERDLARLSPPDAGSPTLPLPSDTRPEHLGGPPVVASA